MIQIKNLTKTYNSNKNNQVIALNNISLSLPDKGMVFICGESGSGKTTLFNIIANFDDITEGQIVVDGNIINDFSLAESEDYRNKVIGFVFQDYSLINNLTIRENIELPLILQNKDVDSHIDEIIKKVGLSGLENRYPNELSGGQKQRVAIARCLIKNPKYILADEPTGNLDKETSIQILDLLKEISNDRLVLLISHNKSHAYKYCDRLIEIEDGCIINDALRDTIITVQNNVISFPSEYKLSENELTEINNLIETGQYHISQNDLTFNKSVQEIEECHVPIEKTKKLTLKNLYRLSTTFKKSSKYLIFNSLLISLLLILLLISQLFFYFDENKFIKDNSENTLDFVLYREIRSKHYISPIFQENIDEFYDLGYSGNIYKLYNYNMGIGEPNGAKDEKHSIATQNQLTYDFLSNPFVLAGKGVLECDKEYLLDKYGIDGKLEVLAGSIEDSGECELIITDYFADCIKYYRDLTYQQIVDIPYIEMELTRFKVKAIINTNYKERYRDLLLDYSEVLEIDNIHDRKVEYEKLKNEKAFSDLYNELTTFLTIGFFIDGDFIERLFSDSEALNGMWSIKQRFYNLNGKQEFFKTGGIGYIFDPNVAPGEVVFGENAYELLYGPEDPLTDPRDVVLVENLISAEPKDKGFVKQLKIVDVDPAKGYNIHLSSEDYKDIYKFLLLNYGLYFDNPSSAKSIYYEHKQLEYFSNDALFNALHVVTKILHVFKFVFVIFTYMVYFAIAFILVSFAYQNIKKKIYDIGVLKALGVKSIDIFKIIMCQIFMMLLMVLLLSTIPILILDTQINKVLLDGIIYFNDTYILNNITIVEFNPLVVFKNFLFISLLIILSSTVLLTKLKKIKPVNIIKADKN